MDSLACEYDLATGLELRKTYADGKGTVKTYDAYNNLATVTDARGVVVTCSYDIPRGLLTGIDFSDGTPAQKFTYNFLGQLTAVQDASGARSISYGRYGSQLEEVQQIASSRFLLQEQRDAYGRSTGYILKRNGNRQCAATVAYGTLGRIALAGFIHAGVEHQFRYGYLAGSNLLQSLIMPNRVTLTQSYEEKRDLLTGMDYVRDNSLITQRQYNYDALGRPVTRDTRYPNKAIHHADTFAYNKRSELTGALLDENAYTYAYDNIGNREIAQEVAEGITYAANDLNQYTRISTNGENFTPEYDSDGNQTLIQTSTGIWKVQYNAQNRAIKFESEDGHTVITCGYDYMGRRFEKKVITNGTTTLHERYIYRGYLQIAAYDLREGHAEHPDLRFIIWDPTQEVATRPLAIRENGVWYTYGWDLTKNICELYGQEGFIRTIYTYSPYGQVTAEGDISQPIQWSSEMYDAELGLVYYNYRYYNPLDGRWTRRDPIGEFLASLNLFNFSSPQLFIDLLGLKVCCSGNKPKVKDQAQRECCEEEMQEVSHMTRPPSLGIGNTCLSGHEYIKTNNMQKGLYPASLIKALFLFAWEGVVRDEKVREGDQPAQTFKACPESVKEVEEQLKKNQKNPPDYQLTSSFGGMNCVSYAMHVLQSAGFSPMDPDRWVPQATLDVLEEIGRWFSDQVVMPPLFSPITQML